MNASFATATSNASILFNKKAARVREAKFGQWFSGKKEVIWWLGICTDLALGGLLSIQGLKFYSLFLAAALFKLILLIWYRNHLKNLPTGSADDVLAIDQLAEGSLLPALAGANNPSELWSAIYGHWQSRFFVNRFGLSGQALASQLSTLPADLEILWRVAFDIRSKLGMPQLTAGTLFVASILTLPNSKSYLAQLKLAPADLISGLWWQNRLQERFEYKGGRPLFGGVGRDWAFGYTPLLNRFGSSISRQVENGAFHLNLEIHEPIVEQVVNTLAQPTKSSVALIGETGVGKTTLAFRVAERLLKGEAPPALRYEQIVSLNASVLIAQAKNRGELEGLVLSLLAEAAHARNITIFLDDAHLFFTDETGGVNLTNILLPVLQGGAVRLIVAMAPSQWQRLAAVSPDLAALFNYQAMAEPKEAIILAALEDQAIVIEFQTKTTITYQAIREALRLAERYSVDQVNPGRSIKILLSAANYTKAGIVTAASVQQAVESTLGVKVTEASAVEKSQLLNLETKLHEHMINQDHAVKVVADALRRARAGVKNANRPIGSFLFLGPTGVGKTQLSKALAQVYFGGPERMIRVDMSEYASAADVRRLLAAGTANQAYPFLMQVRSQPFSLVLLDEIEKAHPEVLNLLLQMLDEGNLTDLDGRKVSFKEVIVIITSNAGADEIRKHIEAGQSLEQFSAQFVDNLINQKQFLPELINRFDEIVLFRPLSASELKQVVGLMMDEVNKELSNQKIAVKLNSEAEDWLVRTANDPRLGARPLRRMVQRTVENIAAQRILEGSLKAGQILELTAQDLQPLLNDAA